MKNIERINVSKQTNAPVKRCVTREPYTLTRMLITCPSTVIMSVLSEPHPGRFTHGKDNRYPFYRRLGWPQGRTGRVRKISPLLELIPRLALSAVTISTSLPGPQSYTRSWFCVRPQRCKKQMLSSSCPSDIRSTDFFEIYMGVFY